MSHTVQQVLDAAIERSDLNNPNLVPPAQILTYLSQYEKMAYTRAARVNPEYFGTDAVTATRTSYTGTWDLATSPGNIAALTEVYVETVVGTPSAAAGDKVNLVGMRWADVDIAPRATLRGKVLKDYNSELSDGASDYVSVLRLYYSPLPNALSSLTQSVSLPDEWINLLIIPLAVVLSIRDGRMEEVEPLKMELNELRALFDDAMTVFDHGVTRPLISVPAIPIPQAQ